MTPVIRFNHGYPLWDEQQVRVDPSLRELILSHTSTQTRQTLHTAKSPLEPKPTKKQPKKSAFGKEHCHFSSIMVSKAEKRLVFREGNTHTHTSCSQPRLPITSRWQLSGVAMPRGCNFLNLQICCRKNRVFPCFFFLWCFFLWFSNPSLQEFSPSFAQVFYGIFLFEKRFVAVEKWLELIPKMILKGEEPAPSTEEARPAPPQVWMWDDVGKRYWIMLSSSGITSWITIVFKKKISRQHVHLHLIPGVFFLGEMTLHDSQLISQQQSRWSGSFRHRPDGRWLGGPKMSRKKSMPTGRKRRKRVKKDCLLGGGFKYVLFSSLPGEMIQFD